MASGGSLSPDVVRACMMPLTSKDPAVVEEALTGLADHMPTVVGSEALTVLADEAVVPRLLHVLASFSSGSSSGVRPSPLSAALALEVLAAVVAVDATTQLALAKDRTSKKIIAVIQAHPSDWRVVEAAMAIIVAIAPHEKNVGLVARLDGGIGVMLSVVQTAGAPPQVCLHALALLRLYCRSSENNVGMLVKSGGMGTLFRLLQAHRSHVGVVTGTLLVMVVCAGNADASITLGEMGVIGNALSLFVYQDRTLMMAVLDLLHALTLQDANCRLLWDAGGFGVLWAALAKPAVASFVVKPITTVLWRMLAATVSYRDADGTAGGCAAGGVNLNQCRVWALPRVRAVPPRESASTSSDMDSATDTDTLADAGASVPLAAGTGSNGGALPQVGDTSRPPPPLSTMSDKPMLTLPPSPSTSLRFSPVAIAKPVEDTVLPTIKGAEAASSDPDPPPTLKPSSSVAEALNRLPAAQLAPKPEGLTPLTSLPTPRSQSAPQSTASTPRATSPVATPSPQADPPQATWLYVPHWFPELHLGPVVPATHATKPSTSASTASLPSATPIVLDDVSPPAPESAGAGGAPRLVPVPPKSLSRLASSPRGSRASPGRALHPSSTPASPSSRSSRRNVSSFFDTYQLPDAGPEEVTSPASLLRRAVELFDARLPFVEAVVRAKPPPLPPLPVAGVFVSDAGIISARPFVLSAAAVPSLQHVRPPPLPEPFVPTSDEAVETLCMRSMLSEVLRLATATSLPELLSPSSNTVPRTPSPKLPPSPVSPPSTAPAEVVYDSFSSSCNDLLVSQLTSTDVLPPLPPVDAKPKVPLAAVSPGPHSPSAFVYPSPTPALPVGVVNVRSIVEDTMAALTLPALPALEFESRFECGNLRSAVRVGRADYELTLEPDTNTRGHTQWFYFRVQGMTPGERYTFNVVNLEKPSSTYNEGMRPLMYLSRREDAAVPAVATSRPVTPPASPHTKAPLSPSPPAGSPPAHVPVAPGDGWRRVGDFVCYYRNRYTKHPQETFVSPAPPTVPHDTPAEAPAEDDPTCVAPAVGGNPVGRLQQGVSLPAHDGVTLDAMHTATWSVVFPQGTKTVFFAYCYPYSYSDLQLDLRRWQHRAKLLSVRAPVGLQVGDVAPPAATDDDADSLHTVVPSTVGAGFTSNVLVQSTLCHALSGTAAPLLTITDFWSPTAEVLQRPYVVLSARVHPGETNASWMMRGVLEFLTSSDPVAQTLRRLCVFKVVPFLNPDGVINGHHRTNLAGLDLNRQWSTPTVSVSPTVYHLRELIKTLCDESRRPLLYCDFHGHSRKKNVFMFGCDNSNGVPERLFPKMLSTRSPDFSYTDCRFKVERSKRNAARVAIWRDFNITNCYTIEASFAGASEGVNADLHFTTENYERMGWDFCRSLLDLLQSTGSATAEMKELAELHPSKFRKLKPPTTKPPKVTRKASSMRSVGKSGTGKRVVKRSSTLRNKTGNTKKR